MDRGVNARLAQGLDFALLIPLPEVDDCQGGTAAGVVDDVPDDSLDVAIPFAVVNRAEPGSTLAVLGVALEDGASALSLGADDAPHDELVGEGRHGREAEEVKVEKEETAVLRAETNLGSSSKAPFCPFWALYSEHSSSSKYDIFNEVAMFVSRLRHKTVCSPL